MSHEPKPLIEEHWHIQELIKAQKKRAEEREYYRNGAKIQASRQEAIALEPPFALKDFNCQTCNIDFKAPAHLFIEVDWSNTTQNIAFYKTKHHHCGTWCIRHSTDKLEDAFWSRSKQVAIDRGKHSIDLLQPFENNYNLVWGKK